MRNDLKMYITTQSIATNCFENLGSTKLKAESYVIFYFEKHATKKTRPLKDQGPVNTAHFILEPHTNFIAIYTET